jgi:phosphohistidine phosphatase
MGSYLAAVDEVPAQVLTSTALRARETVRIAMEAGDWACPVEERSELYETSPADVLDLVAAHDDEIPRLLLAGHEPTWSGLAQLLVGGASLRFPTAAVARIDFEVESWRDVRAGSGTLRWLLTPKELARGKR